MGVRIVRSDLQNLSERPKLPVTKLVTVLIFAIFWPRHPKTGVLGLSIGERRAQSERVRPVLTCEICTRDANNAPNLKL